MIKITKQDRNFQYDECGNKITHWDEEKHLWIVNDEYVGDFKNGQISWPNIDQKHIECETEESFIEKYPMFNNALKENM